MLPPLKPLHPDSSLSRAKLDKMNAFTTAVLLTSLLPGKRDCLKARPDGTILDGHHRLKILKSRGVDINTLPREIVLKEKL